MIQPAAIAQTDQAAASASNPNHPGVYSGDAPTGRAATDESSFLSPGLVPTAPAPEGPTMEEELASLRDHREDAAFTVPQDDFGAPQSEKKTGQMRSDRLPLPDGVTKEEADEAEVIEAKLNQRNRLRGESATGCEVFWPSPSLVCGAILERYKQIGGPVSWLGLPQTNELTNPDGQGRRTEFMGGSIYWHPATGAHGVTLDGMRQWGTLGWESGPLGYPTSGPIDINIPLTQMQTFVGGDNYYNPLTGGAVWGDIKQRYDQMGGSHHPIGIPISNEMASGDHYLYNNFSNGTISWRSDRQTRFMYKATQSIWEANGRETGVLGFPVSDEQADIPRVKHRVKFSDGEIFWGALLGAIAVNGQAYRAWQTFEEDRPLGYPIGLSFDPLVNSIETEFGFIEFTEDGLRVGVGNSDYLSGIDPGEEILPESRGEVSTESNIVLEQSDESDTAPAIDLEEESPFARATNDSFSPARILRMVYIGASDPVVIRFGAYNGRSGFGLVKAHVKHNVTNQDTISQVFIKGANMEPDNKTAIVRQYNYFRLECDRSLLGTRCEKTKDIPVRGISATFQPQNFEFHGYPTRASRTDNAPMGLISIYCPNEAGAELCDDFINLPATVRAAE